MSDAWLNDEWWDFALCKGTETHLLDHNWSRKMSGPTILQILKAKKICKDCPVRQECHDFFVKGAGKEWPMYDVIVGGLDPFELNRARGKKEHRTLPEVTGRCGTLNGFAMHLVKDEMICSSCRSAEHRSVVMKKTWARRHLN